MSYTPGQILTAAQLNASFTQSTSFTQSGTGAVTQSVQTALSERVSITQFGGSTTNVDNGPAIQLASNALSITGGVIEIPRGTWNVMTEFTLSPNVWLRGAGIGATVLNYANQASGNWLSVIGTVGAQTAIAAAIGTSSTSVSTVSATGAAVDDDWLLVSQRNALSSDGGDWQLGVATGGNHATYYAEIMTVTGITSSTAFTFNPPLIFPSYNQNNASETNAYARAAATVQKVSWAKGVRISGMTFVAGANSTNIMNFVYAKHCVVDGCEFQMGTYAGTPIQFTNSYLCKGTNCNVKHSAATGAIGTNYLYNTYKVVSAWYCGFENCEELNGSQCFDTTYNDFSYPSLFNYVKGCTSVNALYAGATSHSGNYGQQFLNNRLIGCSSGIFFRSRKTVVSGNIITGQAQTSGNVGVYASDGWTQDSLVSDNIVQGFYNGLQYGDFNLVDGLINGRTAFVDNIVTDCFTGFYGYHDPAWLTAAYCGLSIRGNKFYRLKANGIWLTSYLNGVVVDSNEVHGPLLTNNSSSDGIALANNSIDCEITNNKLFDLGTLVVPIIIPSITDTTTFPTATYPNNGYELRNNRVIGVSNGSIVADVTSLKTRVRTWAPMVNGMAHWEASGGAYATLVTDAVSKSALYFANPTNQRQGGFEYNNNGDSLTMRVANNYTCQWNPNNFVPYSDNALSLGNSTHRWTSVYAVTSYFVGSVQVVGAQVTGYGTPTGASRTASFNGASATLAQTSAQLAQLILDLKAHGLLGA